ncbi:MAG: glycosyltransferase family 2 protein [Gammaproteobacteria bacterium]|nr:glycosyltransferase family 2 protein [Gammaproteobacteria bacterium]
MSDISVIIVNYNTAEEIVSCIDSILIQQEVSVEILVWDNASQDNSLEVLRRFTDKIQFVASKENLGFGKASNLLVKQATSPYIFLLNPDAYLQSCHTLIELINFMRQNPQYGMVGARLINEDMSSEDPALRAMESRRLRPVVRSRRRFLADRFAGTAKAPDFSLIP